MVEPRMDDSLHFKVRAGLVIHRRIFTDRHEGRRKVRDVRTESYGSGFGVTMIDLPPSEVPMFAHALEPTDERSAGALEALHFRPPVRAQEVSFEQRLAAQVATATIQALIAAGLLKAPSAARAALSRT